MFPISETASVGELVAQHMEMIYPPADMPVLTRYDCTRTVNQVNVQIRSPKSQYWRDTAGIELGREIVVPTSYSGIYCGGPWFSRQPNRGCSPEEAESIKTGTDTVIKDWDEFCANQDRKEKERIPETLEPFFFRIVEERDRYNVEYKAITAWPAQWKETAGKYPT
jgi:hypothetical protein